MPQYSGSTVACLSETFVITSITTRCFLAYVIGIPINTGKKGKVLPVTGRGGPWGCKTSRLPRFVDSRLTDGARLSVLRAGRALPQRKCHSTGP
jgi:hypothetical protein